MPAGEVQILKARSVEVLSGMLRRPSQASASVEATDGAIAEIARDGINSCSSMRPAFICREVLVKLVWVVERFHKYSQNKITAAVMGLVSAAALQVETAQDVAEISPCTRKTGFDF